VVLSIMAGHGGCPSQVLAVLSIRWSEVIPSPSRLSYPVGRAALPVAAPARHLRSIRVLP
jgi:hypothetical protein